jgi:hypothetical protein
MKNLIGGTLTSGGILGVIYFSYNYFQEAESFSVFGTDIIISSGDYMPIVISAVVLGVGILISRINFR